MTAAIDVVQRERTPLEDDAITEIVSVSSRTRHLLVEPLALRRAVSVLGTFDRAWSGSSCREGSGALADGGLDALHDVVVEEWEDVQGPEVVGHLLGPARAGDHRRDVRVLARTTRARAARASSRAPPRSTAAGAPSRSTRGPSASWRATRSRGASPRLPSGTPSRYLPVSSPDASGLHVVRPMPMSS